MFLLEREELVAQLDHLPKYDSRSKFFPGYKEVLALMEVLLSPLIHLLKLLEKTLAILLPSYYCKQVLKHDICIYFERTTLFINLERMIT